MRQQKEIQRIHVKNDNYWNKIVRIGNYCQLKTACCLPYSRYLNDEKAVFQEEK